MKNRATAAAAFALALLTFFQFPGRTYLQQDSQIYVPILEHLRDPAVLRNDILVQQPHVSFTVYDETARFLRRVSGLGFRQVLTFEQIVTRALGILGLYLMAVALGLSWCPAMVVAAIYSLGAAILGPEVLTFEYEPTPRAFAVPLLIFGMGLASRGRYLAAGVAGAAAFLYHPPTSIPFWAVFAVVLAVRRRPWGFAPLGAACVILALAAWSQACAGEEQSFFSRLTPFQEQLQRMRASYVYISTWPVGRMLHYILVSGILLAAFARIRREVSLELGIFLLGLPALGLLTMPLSCLLLECGKWALVPQVQPMRALLFVALSMQFLTAAAGVLAVGQRRTWEAFGWFALAYLLPLQRVLIQPFPPRRVAVLLVLAALTAIGARFDWRLAPAVAAAAFFAIPLVGGVVNYPNLHTPELAQLSEWARTSTSPDSVFVFPDADRALFPGIFRSEALRAVYVDWKGGGQVNYLKNFAGQWWFRWQQTLAHGFQPADLSRYDGLGIAYVVVRPRSRLPRAAAFENAGFIVYAAK